MTKGRGASVERMRPSFLAYGRGTDAGPGPDRGPGAADGDADGRGGRAARRRPPRHGVSGRPAERTARTRVVELYEGEPTTRPPLARRSFKRPGDPSGRAHSRTVRAFGSHPV
ncbi:hypothetical protein GCM10010327_36310 [Streptomyces nitrosporeus]|nr:hypothetical protein GCM10010327_36310 [Streptomyces nitrosporeus]